MAATVLRALLSHWARRPFQLATLVLGLALATALWSGVQAINAEARASYDSAAATLGETTLARIVPESGGAIPQETYVALRRAGWLVSPVIEGSRIVAGQRVRFIGLDPLTAPDGTAAPRLTELDDPADFFRPDGLLLADEATARALIGNDLPEVRVAEGIPPGTAIGDIGLVQTLLGESGRLTRLLVLPDQPMGRPPLSDIAPGLILAEPEGEADLARLTDSFHLNLTAFGLLSFAVGLLIVNGAVGLAFEQRRPVFRTLRALGVPLGLLAALLAVELLVFAVFAGALGVALGYVIAAALLPDVAATLRGLYGASVPGSITVRPEWWLAGFGIALLGTALAGTSRIVQVMRMPLLAPAQPRAWSRASERMLVWQVTAAVALTTLAWLAGRYGSGLLSAFTLLGGLLVASALLLPGLLSVVLALGARLAKGPIAQWFWADTRQQLPGLSLALMALLLALGANIGVGTMVSSFRLTFTGWLDQRLASELYVTAGSDAQGAEMRAWLEDRADAVLPIWHVEAEVAGAPAEIYGVADHPTYRENWPLLAALPDVWDRVANDAALINEQLARREGLRPGDSLPLPGGWSAEIAGIYSDYGNPIGQVLIGIENLLTHYPAVEKRRFGIRIAPEKAQHLARELQAAFDLPDTSLIDQASLKSFSLQVFERTFAVTGALNVLTLLVAGFAILTSLLTLAAMRLPQLAPVWAMGLTRARLARIELLRALLLAALTAIAAIPVGLFLAWVLLAVVNVEAFGWRLPMFLFPAQWALMFALALLCGALAAALPARRLARLAPAELLKVFAHER